MHILVRAATHDDARLLAELTRACWAGKVALSSSGHRETAIGVARQLQDGGAFVLLVDREPAGSVRWLPLATEPGAWEIMRMGVLPALRGANLSQHLLEAVIHHALANEIGELRLAVRADQPRLLGLYAAHGFELAPDLEYSHPNPTEPAPTMLRRVLNRSQK